MNLPTHPIMEIDDEVIRLQRQLAEIRTEARAVADELADYINFFSPNNPLRPNHLRPLVARLRKIAEGK